MHVYRAEQNHVQPFFFVIPRLDQEKQHLSFCSLLDIVKATSKEYNRE
jgi:hypothetical protein